MTKKIGLDQTDRRIKNARNESKQWNRYAAMMILSVLPFLGGCATSSAFEISRPPKRVFLGFVPERFVLTDRALQVFGSAYSHTQANESREVFARYPLDTGTNLQDGYPRWEFIEESEMDVGKVIEWRFRKDRINYYEENIIALSESKTPSGIVLLDPWVDHEGQSEIQGRMAARMGTFISPNGQKRMIMPSVSETYDHHKSIIMRTFLVPPSLVLDVVTLPIQIPVGIVILGAAKGVGTATGL